MKFLLTPVALMLISLFTFLAIPSFKTNQQKTFSLSVETNNLKNSNGSVVFALYNREDAFPDEHYKKYYKKITGKIENKAASVVFKDLSAGKYAVNILHDEDSNGKIKKGFILPKEGIGFSNFQSIGLSNKPSFKKASFEVNADKSIAVKMIYF
jgi:uncharacterized protein (DUF2141 family)